MLTSLRGLRFEAQLTAVKERLEAAKLGSTRGLVGGGGGGPPTPSTASFAQIGGFSFGGTGSRIAKPLRGGGGSGAETNGGMAQPPVISGLRGSEDGGSPAGPGGNKRTSWFFNQR